MAQAHSHEDEDHEHEEVHFLESVASDANIAQIRETNATLADCLTLTNRFGSLTDEEKTKAAEAQKLVEDEIAWMAGYHAEGDHCATCGTPTMALFSDRFQEGTIPYGAFLRGLPVHAARSCLDGFLNVRRDLSPRGLDKARRETMRDLDRPSPNLTQYFRHDLLAQPPFGLEDWANSVAEANPDGIEKAAMRDIERLARWLHQRLFHH